MSTYEEEFDKMMAEYSDKYDIESLESPNDQEMLHNMIRNAITIKSLQQKEERLLTGEEESADAIMELKKIGDLVRDRTNTNIKIQQLLGIDRKTRKSDDSMSAAEYIRFIKSEGKRYLDERLSYIECPRCKILLGRFVVYNTFMPYSITVKCRQCAENVKITRRQKDKYWDIPDSDWRRKHQGVVIQPDDNTYKVIEDEGSEIIVAELPETINEDEIQDDALSSSEEGVTYGIKDKAE